LIKKITSLLFCMLLIGCGSPNTTSQSEIPELDEIQDINRSITFIQFNILPDNMISLAIVNHSTHPVWFPADWHIMLFIKNNSGQWQQIQNQLTYSGENLLYPFAQGGLGNIVIKPDTKGLSTTFRVVVIGNVYQGKPTDSQVAAYIDINIKP
jgi:hypothetical protein